MSTTAATLEQPPPTKRRRRWPIVVAATLLLAAVGGGAAWYLLGAQAPVDDAVAQAQAAEKRKREHVFVTLEPFVVNLANRDAERYAQIGVVLEVTGKKAAQTVADKMPAVRNAVLLLISSKTASELIPRPGKEQLAAEIAHHASIALGWTPPAADKAGADRAFASDKTGGAEKVADRAAADRAAGAAKSTASKSAPAPAAKTPPPVANVHFSSFIVQ